MLVSTYWHLFWRCGYVLTERLFYNAMLYTCGRGAIMKTIIKFLGKICYCHHIIARVGKRSVCWLWCNNLLQFYLCPSWPFIKTVNKIIARKTVLALYNFRKYLCAIQPFYLVTGYLWINGAVLLDIFKVLPVWTLELLIL